MSSGMSGTGGTGMHQGPMNGTGAQAMGMNGSGTHGTMQGGAGNTGTTQYGQMIGGGMTTKQPPAITTIK